MIHFDQQNVVKWCCILSKACSYHIFSFPFHVLECSFLEPSHHALRSPSHMRRPHGRESRSPSQELQLSPQRQPTPRAKDVSEPSRICQPSWTLLWLQLQLASDGEELPHIIVGSNKVVVGLSLHVRGGLLHSNRELKPVAFVLLFVFC